MRPDGAPPPRLLPAAVAAPAAAPAPPQRPPRQPTYPRFRTDKADETGVKPCVNEDKSF